VKLAGNNRHRHYPPGGRRPNQLLNMGIYEMKYTGEKKTALRKRPGKNVNSRKDYRPPLFLSSPEYKKNQEHNLRLFTEFFLRPKDKRHGAEPDRTETQGTLF